MVAIDPFLSHASESSAVAAPPHYALRASRDVDEHATHISAWHQEYDQISCGDFTGAVRELCVDAPRLQVFHEHTGQQTSQRCLPWRGAIWFGVPDACNAAPLHFSGSTQPLERERRVLCARADDGFVLRTPRDFGIYGVVIDEEWLGNQLDRMGARALLRPATASGSTHATVLSAHRHAALCQTIESMLALGASGEIALQWGRTALQALTDRLLCLLGDAAQSAEQKAVDLTARRRLRAVMTARSLAIDPVNHDLTVDALCERLHVTPRTLHNHFQGAVGESPTEFLRAVRLNACRRRLRAEACDVNVQDVAAQWGFFHMGRFSHAYKTLFGELPSQTLREARRNPH
ncbi:helix-turn-helix domain-containing protein [Variovorax ginsengisoli]|uniref:AraC family ethanolamine operon transcriptional activator n=1 Tax=Variovorax ginsengisoli TaxID=363844 RepID=A0ABT9S435_9BURK|nr:helix-turn-helix domain-containing protein [Variovorax ginsengisoli]MDP9899111.1 AraC family ethanolamine operon transcriptional activator [Variovorax ginsengisoli]